MKKTVFLFAFFILFSVQQSFAQHTLVLHIEGVKTEVGSIGIAIYNTKDTFLDLENVYRAEMHKAKKGTTTVTIDNLEKGTYAIAIYHDENDNQVLDTNIVGIPKEPVAFSIGKLKMFGPPSFKECTFIFNADKELTIAFN